MMRYRSRQSLYLILLGALWLLSACIHPLKTTDASDTPAAQSEPGTLTIYYTNDEHGWMEGQSETAAAANLAGLWQVDEPVGHILVLSGGDNWTGPAISTWFDGRSMVEVMNAMGYAASAVGNHEFDFGLEAMQARFAEANFPFVAANLRYRADGRVPTDLGIFPFQIIDLGDIQIGVVGLTTRRTPSTTNPVNVADFDFIDYEEALREVVPQARAAGADMIVAPAHVCLNELTRLAVQVADLQIAMLGAGHCNERAARELDDTVILAGGAHMAAYATVTLTYDPQSGQVLEIENLAVIDNQGGQPDPTIAGIVERWRTATDAELDVVIGFLDQELPQRSQAMQDLVGESWLLGYPTADVAITNLGGFRAALPAGEVTLADIVGVLPFNNVLVDVRLTGSQLLDVLEVDGRPPAVAGLTRKAGDWIEDDSGLPIDDNGIYQVLVNDFMYAGGDDFAQLAEYDPDAYDTAIDWRQPVIDWITAQGSSAERPLDQLIADLANR